MSTAVVPWSWAEEIRATLERLEVAPEGAERLRAAHRDIASEWEGLDPTHRTPFPSGVCPDGSPLEFSLQFHRQGTHQTRFISHPLPEDPTRLKERVRTFVSRWAGPGAAALAEAALAIYPEAPDPSFEGNFRIWLGLATNEAGAHAAKVYFNPWACEGSLQGAYALQHLVRTAGWDLEPLRALPPWIQPPFQGRPHIVGWNLMEGAVSSLKLYLQAHASLRTLRTIGGLEGLDLAREWGEVHLALVFKPGRPHQVRVNLFAPDWFPSDEAALGFLRASGQGWVEASLEPLSRLVAHPGLVGRRITFLGVDEDVLTVYFRMGGLGSPR